MQPRTKGPSWADNPTPQLATGISRKKGEEAEKPRDQEGLVNAESPDGLSDMEWMKRRMKQDVEDAGAASDKVFEQSDDEEQGVDAMDVQTEVKDLAKETILQTARLFVRNLPFSCTEAELRDLFQPFGEVSQVSRLFPSRSRLRARCLQDDKMHRDIRLSTSMLIYAGTR